MTTKAEAAAAERKVMERYGDRLADAYFDRRTKSVRGMMTVLECEAAGDDLLRILTASAKALFPGAQKRKHVLPALGVMVTAACRVIRRGGGK